MTYRISYMVNPGQIGFFYGRGESFEECVENAFENLIDHLRQHDEPFLVERVIFEDAVAIAA